MSIWDDDDSWRDNQASDEGQQEETPFITALPQPDQAQPDIQFPGNEEPVEAPSAPNQTESPREVFRPDQPTEPINKPRVTQRAPSTGGDGSDNGGTTNAPARPKTPTPVASMSPEPFSPMQQMDPVGLVSPRDPGAQNVAMRAPSMGAPAMPTSPTPVALRSNPYSPVPMQFADNKRSAGLLGQAGGALGGGLGVVGSGDGPEQISALLKLLLGGDQGESY